MSEHKDPDPDPEIIELLALLDARESFQEVEQLVEQSSAPAPEIHVEPIDDENRFAATVVSVMSKGRAR